MKPTPKLRSTTKVESKLKRFQNVNEVNMHFNNYLTSVHEKTKHLDEHLIYAQYRTILERRT